MRPPLKRASTFSGKGYVAGSAGPQKSVFMASSLVRLGAITAVAIVVIVVARQVGWGMVFGLALFQFVVLASTARTLLKSLRSGT